MARPRTATLDKLGMAVFGLIVPWLDGVLFLTLHDTLARKPGLKIFGVGMHHDPLASTRKTAITNWGHSWVILSVDVRFPFADRTFSLPILFRLYVSKQTVAKRGGRYRTRPELAVELLQLLCSRHENRRFHAVADATYGGHSVLARLHDAPPPRRPGTNGRPRKRGARLPTPRELLQRRSRRLTLDIYGRHDRVRVAECEARLHSAPERPVRVLAVEPLSGGRRTQAFYSTACRSTPAELLTRYARRWSIEQAIQDSKMHLGFEEPQGWTRRAVERTAPVAMLLYSLIVLWFARSGHRDYSVPDRPWYSTKSQASFADMLATLRCQSIRSQVSSLALRGRGSRKVVKTLLQPVKQAA